MYNVIEDIRSLKSILLDDDLTNMIPLNKVNVRLLGTPKSSNQLLSDTNPEDWERIYNNVVLSGGSLEGDLIILQDYGDHEGSLISYEETEVPREMLFLSDSGSIGHYQGKLYYFIIESNTLVGYKLSEHELGDLSYLYDKRPFDFLTYIGSWDNVYDQLVKFRLLINTSNDSGQIIEGDLGVTYSQIANPKHLESVIGFIKNESSNLGVVDTNKYLTNDYLIDNEFSYDSSTKEFKKLVDNEEIVIKYNNGYYLVNNKNIFTIDEVESLINK